MERKISIGDCVKAISREEKRVGGYAVRWGSEQDRDLTGEFFTKSTSFWEPESSFGVFDHGLDARLGPNRIGRFTLKSDDIGIYAEGSLSAISWSKEISDRADEYLSEIYRLAEEGKLGWSSGSSPYLARVKSNGEIEVWPWVELSLTGTPAEWRNRVVPLKSLVAARSGAKAGRTLSGVNWNMFNEIEIQMRANLDLTREFLDRHKPEGADSNSLGDPEGDELEELARATLLLM